jgi:choline dehydrogenase-like flavoprotein
MPEAFDVLIIGSGAGGATVASELAPLCAEGARIAVLERGPKFRDEEFTGHELEMAEKLFFDSGAIGNQDQTLTVACVHGYGGSTLAYTGTSIEIPQRSLDRWAVPGLTLADLAPRMAKFKQQNNVHELPDEDINENNTLFRRGCEKLCYRAKKFPVNIKGCLGSGMCNMGCPNQAKQGTNRVQLPDAERRGVQVIANCRVERIDRQSLTVDVGEWPYGEKPRWPLGRYELRARVIVVAAGAMHSSALLMHSRLPVSLPALGRYFTCHPALTLVAQHAQPITNYFGFPKTFYCDDFEETDHFILETCIYFPFTTAKNMVGFGPAHSAMMADFRRLQMILVLVSDPALAANRITVNRNGDPVLEYRMGDLVLNAFVKSQMVAARIFFAGGAERVHAPASPQFVIERPEQDRIDQLIDRAHLQLGKISVSSAHPMGGCRMGAGPATSVTNEWGKVHGLNWLYVADGSLFPASSGVNPYLTIMALADRVAERLRECWADGTMPPIHLPHESRPLRNPGSRP